MAITSLDDLAKLTKEQLWQAALNKENGRDVQDEALRRWMAIDDRDYENSIQRIRALLDQLRATGPGLNDKWIDFPDLRKSA